MDADQFRNTPLITPERIESDWKEALDILPPWARSRDFLCGRVILVPVWGLHPATPFFPPYELALLAEVTRYGHTIVTNSNFSPSGPRVYLKVSFRDAPGHNITIRRILSGAAEDEAVKALNIESDYSAANSYFVPDARAKRDARKEAIEQAEKLAGEFVDPVGVAAYVANIRALFAAIDASAVELPDAAE
ncbi:MAG: hypothetical protein E5Y88_27245 [Mesorhizobium sp.]|uniref:hypothetical protein n=1 Tax=Mesorhizobium sp. TaxID=1871066 RepID=UPI000FE69788|nr:hypothetical protein [Mesorhizobium sp.]RWQ28877.1 MAG: hypothetical protein EOS20_33700 [Mesorhizobium sp.]TIL22515.1 MAG: hypothetical protein E5Y88_27245 [Mesorhizobium sp.]